MTGVQTCALPILHAFQMLFIRSVIGIAILLPVIARSRRGWGQIGRRYLPGHLLRNVIHFTGQVLWIFGIALLPLATVAAIEFTSPLWAGVLAMLSSEEHTSELQSLMRISYAHFCLKK